MNQRVLYHIPMRTSSLKSNIFIMVLKYYIFIVLKIPAGSVSIIRRYPDLWFTNNGQSRDVNLCLHYKGKMSRWTWRVPDIFRRLPGRIASPVRVSRFRTTDYQENADFIDRLSASFCQSAVLRGSVHSANPGYFWRHSIARIHRMNGFGSFW